MAVEKLGDVIVVAPHVERSGSGQGLSLTLPLRAERIQNNIYAVEGTPADCMIFAFSKVLDRQPDFVLSGINRGSNIGQDTLYSGTVAAAMEGCLTGVPALSFSLNARRAFELSDYMDAMKVVRMLFERRDLLEPAKRCVLNVNIPHLPIEQIKGFSVAKLGRRIYDQQIVEGTDPRGRPYYWVGGGGEAFADIPGSDCNLLEQGYVTLTALSPEHVDPTVNQTLKTGLEKGLNQNLSNLRQ
jgi:5'-nucleotidase